MPTTKPRITLTLEQSHYDLLRSLSYHRGVSMAQIAVELLEASAPILRRVDAVLAAAKAANNSYAEAIRTSGAKTELEIAKLYDEAVRQFDEFAAVIEPPAQGSRGSGRRRQARRTAATDPR